MEISNTIMATLANYLVQLPILLVWIVGIVLSIANRRRYPRESKLTGIALSIFLILSLVNTFLNMWLPILLFNRGLGPAQIAPLITIKAIISSLILAVPWGLLVAAIFGGKRKENNQSANQFIDTEH